MHQRQAIRRAAVAALVDRTGAGGRVYPTRVLPARRLELPMIAVYTDDESIDGESASSAPRNLDRAADLVIEALVAVPPPRIDDPVTDFVDDAMDDMALQIEMAMDVDRYLDDTVMDAVMSGTTTEVIQEGDRLMGLVTLTYSVTYQQLPAEAAAVDEFLLAGVTQNLGNEVHTDEDAEDLVDVRA